MIKRKSKRHPQRSDRYGKARRTLISRGVTSLCGLLLWGVTLVLAHADTVDDALYENMAIVHFMADLGTINKDNPHAFKDETSSNELTGPTPIDHILNKPDSTTNDTIPLIDWLHLKLSPVAWENDPGYRDTIPRSIIAIMLEGDNDKITLANTFLRAIKPYSTKSDTNTQRILDSIRTANTEEIHHSIKTLFHAQYDDFTISMWTRLVYLFKDDPIKLEPQTRESMIKNLLKFEGTKYSDTIPNTRAFKSFASQAGYPVTEEGIQNSENHILMINGSAYLKNQLVNNDINPGSELEYKLCADLDDLYTNGLSEYNSIPYAGYTVDALLNLHDFADEPVKSRATRVLDKIFYDYVIHSTHDGKNFRPFARQAKKVENQEFLSDDSVRPFIMTWLGADSAYYRQQKTSRNAMFAFTALTSSYRPPQVVSDLAKKTSGGYLAVTGQRHGNAEISYKNGYEVSGGQRQYLLSGGGLAEDPSASDYLINDTSLNWNPSSRAAAKMRIEKSAAEVVSRNPALILDGADGPTKLEDAFYLGTDNAIRQTVPGTPWGPGIDSKSKNNSGIYFDTLVGAYPVHVPDQYKNNSIKPQNNDAIARMWTLYTINPGLRVAVFDGIIPMDTTQKKQIGIVLLLPGECSDPQALINNIANENRMIDLNNPDNNIAQTVKFPNECGGVMRGKSVRYNPYAALDRWVISGNTDKQWPKEYRFFSRAPMRDNSDKFSPGWSAASVIQEAPDQNPIDYLSPNKNDTFYNFLNLGL